MQSEMTLIYPADELDTFSQYIRIVFLEQNEMLTSEPFLCKKPCHSVPPIDASDTHLTDYYCIIFTVINS